MTRNSIKLSIALVLFFGMLCSSLETEAYPAYLRQALKFGAKNCLFCHAKSTGGEGWNTRGQWLIDEKERRKADDIDVEWLAEYKEGGTKAVEPKAVESKGTETKEGEPKATENKGTETKEGEPKATENKGTETKEGENNNGGHEHEGEKHEGDKKDVDKDGKKGQDKKIKRAPRAPRKRPATKLNSVE